MILKQLDDDWALRREAIFSRELRSRFFKKTSGVRREHIAFLLGRLDYERATLRFAEVLHGVEQVQCILGPDIERIAFESSFDRLAAFLHLAQTQQRHAKAKVRIP